MLIISKIIESVILAEGNPGNDMDTNSRIHEMRSLDDLLESKEKYHTGSLEGLHLIMNDPLTIKMLSFKVSFVVQHR